MNSIAIAIHTFQPIWRERQVWVRFQPCKPVHGRCLKIVTAGMGTKLIRLVHHTVGSVEMTSPINKIRRKRAENLLRDLFVRETLRGMEKTMVVWEMDPMFTENYGKRPSGWRNMYNWVRKEMCGVQCNWDHIIVYQR